MGYYNPKTGRFTQMDTHWNPGNMIYGDSPIKLKEYEDPLGLSYYTYAPDLYAIWQSNNLYAYCINNPVKYLDPNGRFIFLALLAPIVVELLIDVALAIAAAVVTVVAAKEVADIASDAAGTNPTPPSPGKGPNDSRLRGYGDKSERYLNKRGWTWDSARDVVDNPYTTRAATNKATGNPATAYYNRAGDYVVVDDVTGELVQASDVNDPKWIPDSSIVDPYKP